MADRYYLVKVNESSISVVQVDTPRLFSKLWPSFLTTPFSKSPDGIRHAAGWLIGTLHLTPPSEMEARTNPVKN